MEAPLRDSDMICDVEIILTSCSWHSELAGLTFG